LTRNPRSARPGGVTEGVRTFKKQIKASSVSAKETFLEQLRRTETAEQDDGKGLAVIFGNKPVPKLLPARPQ
jgi:hypothetical protein